LITLIVENIENMPFEARKDAALIFNNLMRKNIANFADYVLEGFTVVVSKLIHGYEHSDCALNCGSMLRECVRHDALAEAILNSEHLWKIFDSYVHLPNFEVASDAFNSLRDLLVTAKNKRIAATFLDAQYEAVFQHYEELLKNGNYVTRRRSLKLLGELLLDRSNFRVMMRYIASRDHLKTIMNFLRDPSPNIQFEAFHVFKVFVANPKKTSEISNILYKNKGKLVPFLEAFQTDKGEEQFNDEKRLLIETLVALEKPAASVPTDESFKAAAAGGGGDGGAGASGQASDGGEGR
jgi:calcium binding protein 39